MRRFGWGGGGSMTVIGREEEVPSLERRLWLDVAMVDAI